MVKTNKQAKNNTAHFVSHFTDGLQYNQSASADDENWWKSYLVGAEGASLFSIDIKIKTQLKSLFAI